MPSATTGDLFRPTDPSFLQDPYPTYGRLRAEAPIVWYEGWVAWIVTRDRDVAALLRDGRLGRVVQQRAPPSTRPSPDPARAAFEAVQDGSLLETEPPDHTRVKQVVQDVFTPSHVRALPGRIEAMVAGVLDGLETRPDRVFDLIRDFEEPIPVAVIAELLGVPEADRGQ